MATETYSIVLEYSPRGSLLPSNGGSQLQAAHSAVDSIRLSVADLGQRVSAGLEAAADKALSLTASFAKMAGAAGIAAAAYGVMGLNANLEETQIALGTIFNANGRANGLADGMMTARDQMSQMRRDAAALPGEFSDLVTIFRSVSLPGFQSGQSVDTMREFAAKTMAAGAVAGLQSDMVGREMAMLLQGRAGAHNVLGMQLFGLGGDAAEKFNKLSSAERFEFLAKGIDRFSGSLALYEQSFKGLSSTLVDNAKELLGAATSPLFERVKDSMEQLTQFYQTHKSDLMDLARDIGDKLGAAWDFVIGKARELAPTIDRVKHFVDQMGTSDGLKKIEHIIGMMLAVKLGAAGMGEVFKLGGEGGGLATKIAGAGLGSMGGGAGGGAGLGGLVGSGGIIQLGVELTTAYIGASMLAVGLTALAGIFDALQGGAGSLSTSIRDSWAGIKADFDSAGKDFGAAFEKAKPALMDFAHLVGGVSLQNLSYLADGIAVLGGMANDATTAVKELAGAFGIVGAAAEAGMQQVLAAANKALATIPVAVNHLAADAKKGWGDLKLTFGEKKTPTGGGGGGGGTHIDKLEITVQSNQDPSRIARLTLAEYKKLLANPLNSKNAPNYAIR